MRVRYVYPKTNGRKKVVFNGNITSRWTQNKHRGKKKASFLLSIGHDNNEQENPHMLP